MNTKYSEEQGDGSFMKHLILASGSPRRRELMSQVGLDFTVVTSDADENIKEMKPEDYVRELSSIKAQSVLEQYADKDDSVIVIGADTIVYHKGHASSGQSRYRDLLLAGCHYDSCGGRRSHRFCRRSDTERTECCNFLKGQRH